MTDKNDIKLSISSHALFDSCAESFIEKLSLKSRTLRCEKGQVLFVHQQEAETFYLVLNGWIKLFKETIDGTQAVVDIMPSGHFFGESSIFEDDIYPFSAEAAEESTLVGLPLNLLKQEIEANPKLALAMLSSMARYRKQQDQELEHRTLQNAPQRIGCFLLRIADQNHEGSLSIQLPYDKTLVAARLGMQPETFSRALAKLKNATGIRIKGATIELDNLEQLTNFSCIACTSEFPCKDLPQLSKR